LNKNSRFTCPELLSRVCNDCPNYNHTYDRCPKRHRTSKPVEQSATKSLAKTTTVAKTKFDCLYESDDENDSCISKATAEGVSKATTAEGVSKATTAEGVSKATTAEGVSKATTAEGVTQGESNFILYVDYTTEQFRNQPIEDQKNQLGEYIYTIILTTHPQKAGAYTGSLLDLEVDHLISIIETPSKMNEMLVLLIEANI
jgi:hypothetical protein